MKGVRLLPKKNVGVSNPKAKVNQPRYPVPEYSLYRVKESNMKFVAEHAWELVAVAAIIYIVGYEVWFRITQR